MKILKLQSDNTISLSQFTNNLQIPLQLNRQAKVALKTLSFGFQPTTIVIDNTDYMSYTINTIRHTPNFKKSNYNIRELCEMMTNYINELVNSDDEAAQGTEFLCDYVGNAKDGYLFNISFVKSDQYTVNDTNTFLINVAYDNGFYKVDEIENLYVSTMQTNENMSLGGYSYTFTISQQDGHEAEDVADSSWFVGMANQLEGLDSNTDTEITENFSNYIGCVSGFYEYRGGTGRIITDIVPTLGDVITVTKNYVDEYSVQINYNITNGTNSTDLKGVILNNTNIVDIYTLNQDLFIKIGNDNGFIKFSNVQAFGTALSQYSGTEYINLKSDSIKNVKKSLKVTEITVSLLFSDSLLDKLGFKSNPQPQSAVSYKWVADNNTKNAIFNNDLVVTINQLNTDGYNQQLKQKESIIMVITAGSIYANTLTSGQASFNLSYTDNFPTYLNLGNTNSTSYNNLTVSVRSENQLINVSGKMTCTLLFKDETDFELKL
jgi:hypothetical protein